MEDKRLTRGERTALVMLACAENIVHEAEKDLQRRMGEQPEWIQTAHDVRKKLDWMVDASFGTLSPEQLLHMKATARDYELRLKPKMTPAENNTVLDKETLRTLIDAAQVKCTECFNTELESRNCKLQKVLAMLCPMPKYEGEFCVFNLAEWEN